MDAVDKANNQQQQLDEALTVRAKQPPPSRLREDCIDCESPIAALRLKANPHAIRCIGCQEAHEAHKRNYNK